MKNIVNVFDGKDIINVVFLGGSITEGAGASMQENCFANMTGEWLKQKFSEYKVNYYNKGIGGTPSKFGLMRINRDVIKYNPDLVFIEFAVNDNGEDTRKYVEGIVRMLSELPSDPYIIFLYTTNDIYTTDTKYFEEIAEYYGIPQINLKKALRDKLGGENAFESGYMIDDVHPNDNGYAVYYEKMIECLEQEIYYSKPLHKAVLCPDMIRANAEFIPAVEFIKTEGWIVGGEGERKYILAEKPGETIEFEFSGEILAVEHGLHEDSGEYNIYVDDVFIDKRTPYKKDFKSNQLVLGFSTFDLESGTHKVKIETQTGINGGSRILLYNIIVGNKY